MHEEHGVKFYLSAGVKAVVGKGGKVSGVTLPSGETLEADMVVAGVGASPHNTCMSHTCMSQHVPVHVHACPLDVYVDVNMHDLTSPHSKGFTKPQLSLVSNVSLN